ALSATTTQFDNPFITNYESRREQTFALRTFIELHAKKSSAFQYRWNTGLEWQKSYARISNYGNKAGQKDAIQAADRINTDQHFFFTRWSAEILPDLTIEAALSLNAFQYTFASLDTSPTPYPKSSRNFKDQ